MRIRSWVEGKLSVHEAADDDNSVSNASIGDTGRSVLLPVLFEICLLL
jgi:hypothetical protein